MKVLFVTATKDDEPLGSMYLASMVEKEGHKVEAVILDWDNIFKVVKFFQPNIIAYSIITGQQKKYLAINSELKSQHTFLSVWGGVHVTFFPQFIENDGVDLVCIGEGELAFVELLDRLQTGQDIRSVENFWVKINDFVYKNECRPLIENLDSIPFPNRRLYNRYKVDNDYDVITSRGCIYNCFVGGTRVAFSRGKNKSIKNVKVGDRLIAYDDGKLVETIVKRTFVYKASKLLEIRFEDKSRVRCTPEHPFYVKGVWVRAEDLEVGDEIYSISIGNQLSIRKKIDNPMYNRETVLKMVRNRDNSPMSKSLRERWENGIMKGHSMTQELRDAVSKRMSESNPMKNPISAKKRRDTLKRKYRSGEIVHIPSQKQKEVIRKMMLENNPMKNAEIARKAFFKFHRNKINGQEKVLRNILDENFPKEYRYVGDGKVWIVRCNPDFINVNGKKKVIEFNGCYWHGCPICFPKLDIKSSDHEKKRKVYEEYGFKVLNIWEHELKDKKSLINKIGNFTYNGLKVESISIIDLSLGVPISRSYYRKDRVIYRKIEPLVYNLECEPYHNYFAGNLLSHNCSYCYNHQYNSLYRGKGKVPRYRSVENVIQELEEICSLYSPSIFKFHDDLFIFNKERVKDFCEQYRRRVGKPFTCSARVDILDEEIVSMLKSAGCRAVFMGIESGDEVVRKKILRRSMSNEQILKACELLHKYEILIVAQNMIGIPGTGIEEDWRTLELNIVCKPYLAWVSICTPYPGTDLVEMSKEAGLISDDFVDEIPEAYYIRTMLKIPHATQVNNLNKLFPLGVEYPDLLPRISQLLPNENQDWFEEMRVMLSEFRRYKYNNLMDEQMGVPEVVKSFVDTNLRFKGRESYV